MHRGPGYRWFPAGQNQAAGGMEELQTDVMRFLAILAICLVAIFALVQSIPLAPDSSRATTAAAPELPENQTESKEAPPALAVAEPPEPVSVPVNQEPTPIQTAARPDPVRVAQSPFASQGEERRTPPVRQPTPTPPQARAAPVEPASIQQAAEPEPEGFTLRFESDSALKALVAKSEVGLYAVTPGKSWRLSFDRGRLTFWPASTPSQFHEMTTGTVPRDVLGAIRRVGLDAAGASLTWGVTLPKKTTLQLNRILGSHRGGDLVIDATGNLRLEAGRGDGGRA